MKKQLSLILSVVLVNCVCTAGTLVLSGVVPDKGYTVLSRAAGSQVLVPNEGSELKVYVSEIKSASRSPQSVDEKLDSKKINSNRWSKLVKQQTITTSSYIKVEAP